MSNKIGFLNPDIGAKSADDNKLLEKKLAKIKEQKNVALKQEIE